jgi:geranylgeranylglycerol-phosphate geranylgeranyltransferase
MSRLKAYFRLARPVNLLLSTLTVLITASFFIPFPNTTYILSALLTVVLLNAGGNAVNDLYDEAIDKINRPNRPLPSGRLSRKDVRLFAVITFTLGNLAALYAGLLPFIIAAFISTPLMIAYSMYFKRTPLTGNLIIAFILGLAFIFCSLVYGDVKRGIAPAILAFFYTLIREIIKDLEDIKGDKADGAQTLPILVGEKTTRIITGILLFLLLIILPFPTLISFYSDTYLLIVIPFVGLPLFVMALYILFPRESFKYASLSAILKIDMFAGLAAIFAGIHF